MKTKQTVCKCHNLVVISITVCLISYPIIMCSRPKSRTKLLALFERQPIPRINDKRPDRRIRNLIKSCRDKKKPLKRLMRSLENNKRVDCDILHD